MDGGILVFAADIVRHTATPTHILAGGLWLQDSNTNSMGFGPFRRQYVSLENIGRFPCYTGLGGLLLILLNH